MKPRRRRAGAQWAMTVARARGELLAMAAAGSSNRSPQRGGQTDQAGVGAATAAIGPT